MQHCPLVWSCAAPFELITERRASKYFILTSLSLMLIHCLLVMKVGFKPAGGIRTSKDVLQWMTLMKEELGDDYLTPELFRIGASALLNDIERNLTNHFTGGYFLAEEMPMA